MLFSLATNPTAPLMVVALVLAALMLMGVVIYINALNRRYPTAEAQRKLRRSEISGGKLTAGTSLVTLTLLLAIVASVGDVLTYAQNVKQVRDIAASAKIKINDQQAEELLGNDFGYAFKPVVTAVDGTVGSIRVQGAQVHISRLKSNRYILLTDNLGKGSR